MRFHTKASLMMRRRMFRFLPVLPGMTVLEVGATPDTDLEDSNFFSRAAREAGCDVWITSPENCAETAASLGLNWLPFEEFLKDNKSGPRFDLVISSAVLEHLGPEEKTRRDHLRELRAASKRFVAVTTPNRFHWLEFHTKLPFIHWLPKPVHRRILRFLGMSRWAEASHLDLLSAPDLQRSLQAAFAGDSVKIHRLRFLGGVSNLLGLIEKKSAVAP